MATLNQPEGRSFRTLVFTVTYRISKDDPQSEAPFYTREAANYFAFTVVDQGGVAIVTEGVEE